MCTWHYYEHNCHYYEYNNTGSTGQPMQSEETIKEKPNKSNNMRYKNYKSNK